MKYKGIWFIIVFAILIGIVVFLGNSSLKQNKIIQSSQAKNAAPILRETVKVLRIVDGDTIEVSLNNKKESVRLIGIDAPETVDPRSPIQCFGKEASIKAKEILDDKIVVLESDSTQSNRDEYKRLLRYVFLKDGTNFNKFMINEGYAYEYTYKNNLYRYVEKFRNAQKQAKEGRKGLWSDFAKCNYE